MTSLYNLTNLDKELWPSITKNDLITYYIYVGPTMKEYLINRPLALVRAPNGIKGDTFFQKNLPESAPETIMRWEFERGGRNTSYMILNSVEELVYLGNQASIEIHSWLSQITTFEKPSEVVIDLDPKEEVDFSEVKYAAFLIKEILEKTGLQSYPKITGKKGIHILVPLRALYSFIDLDGFFKAFKEFVVNQYPNIFTGELRKDKRNAPIYLDLGQNGLEKTVISPYSPRLVEKATVSVPLSWSELSSLNQKPHWSVEKKYWPPLKKPPKISQILPTVLLGSNKVEVSYS